MNKQNILILVQLSSDARFVVADSFAPSKHYCENSLTGLVVVVLLLNIKKLRSALKYYRKGGRGGGLNHKETCVQKCFILMVDVMLIIHFKIIL